MTNLLQALRGSWSSTGSSSRGISTIDDWFAETLNWFSYNGHAYAGLQQTLTNDDSEEIEHNLQAYVDGVYRDNGVAFAVMALRMLTFSEARLTFQRIRNGSPGELFPSQQLEILERPEASKTTGDLLLRMEQDASLAGNYYAAPIDGEMVRLRPDWCALVLEQRLTGGRKVGKRVAGLLYYEDGDPSVEPARFLPGQFVHYAPYPDPRASYRGMSWLTPVIREVRGDKAMQSHKLKFFENGATPNMVVKLDPEIIKTLTEFREWKAEFDKAYAGADNAYRTMFLRGAADYEVVGKDFQEMSFKTVQGAGETRIAAAGGTPPILVGLSEGLQSATYSNYGQARRRYADATLFPLWRIACGSLGTVVQPPRDGGPARLWFDATDVRFLREDEKDRAEIQSIEARTIRTLLDAGCTFEEVKAALIANDWTLLEHSGLFSVQLQPPGTAMAPPGKFKLTPVSEADDDDQAVSGQEGDQGNDDE